MALVPMVGTVKYNGFLFPSFLKANVQATPVYDSSKRAVKYTRYVITIETLLTPEELTDSAAFDPTTDRGFERLRVALLAPGKELIFKGQGFGDFEINTTRKKRYDLVWGPRPQLLTWTPIGSSQACMVTWQVEVHIKDCYKNKPSHPYLAINYSVDWGIDEYGLTTRTHNGSIETMVFRNGDRITGTADDLRSHIRIPMPLGYKRTQSYVLSEDRRTLSFTVTDIQLPSDNPFFKGTIKPSVTYTVSGNLAKDGFIRWNATLSGTIGVVAGQPRYFAWLAFGRIAKSYQDRSKQGTAPKFNTFSGKWETVNSYMILVTSFSASEQVFGRDSTFSISWLLASNLETIFKSSGMWVALDRTNFDWKKWRTSMYQAGFENTRQPAPFNPRGVYQLFYNHKLDAVVDICSDTTPSFWDADKEVYHRYDGSLYLSGASGVDPDQTYLEYQLGITFDQETGAVKHNPLTRPEDYPEDRTIIRRGRTDATLVPPSQTGSSSSSEQNTSYIQRRHPSSWLITLTGHGIRHGYQINPPRLGMIAGVVPQLIRRKFRQQQISSDIDGRGIYAAQWQITYALPKAPAGNISESGRIIAGEKYELT